MPHTPPSHRGFVRYAWGVVACTLAVILWGAVVRATGSGAGCGRHWPRCDGEILPALDSAKQVVEFTHRVTSGLALLAVVGLLVLARRRYAPGSPTRRAAAASMALMVVEALLGAGLVLLSLVEGDASALRAVAIALHLTNTLFLLAALAMTAWLGAGRRPADLRADPRLTRVLGAAVAAVVLVAALGGVTALGDTLFPSDSLAHGVSQDLSPTAHFLVRLRVIHPVAAVLAGLGVVLAAGFARRRRPGRETAVLARALVALYGAQVVAGVVNLVLLVPLWMQLVHLLLADLLWIALVLTAASALAGAAEPAAAARGRREAAAPAR
jgi:cytochrome c oxidase assembly protein subunit 15